MTSAQQYATYAFSGLTANKGKGPNGAVANTVTAKADGIALAALSPGAGIVENCAQASLQGIRANDSTQHLSSVDAAALAMADANAVAALSPAGDVATDVPNVLCGIRSNSFFSQNSSVKVAELAVSYATILVAGI